MMKTRCLYCMTFTVQEKRKWCLVLGQGVDSWSLAREGERSSLGGQPRGEGCDVAQVLLFAHPASNWTACKVVNQWEKRRSSSVLLPPLGSSPGGNVWGVPGVILQLPSTLQWFLLVPVLSLHTAFFRLAGIKSANNLPLGFRANGPNFTPNSLLILAMMLPLLWKTLILVCCMHNSWQSSVLCTNCCFCLALGGSACELTSVTLNWHF